MKSVINFFAAAILGFLSLAAAPAHAGYTVCNYSTSPVVDVAYATWDTNKKAWVSRGWYKVKNSSCKTIISGTSVGQKYYIYARSTQSHWGGGYYNCTTQQPFTILRSNTNQCTGGNRYGFMEHKMTTGSFTLSLY